MNNNRRLSPEMIRKGIVYAFLYALTGAIVFSTLIFPRLENNDFPTMRLFIIIFASVLLTKYFFYMAVSPWYDVYTYYRERVKRRVLRMLANGSVSAVSHGLDSAHATASAAGSAAYAPKVSVIVPAWNEEVGILNTVGTLLRSSYENVEIVIVNDGSTDNSDAIIRKFVDEYESKRSGATGKSIVYRYQENGGKGRALNTGILLSSGDIIMSIDADCVVMPETIGAFVRCFEDETVMAAVGNVRIGNTGAALGVLQYLEFLFSFYFKKADSLMNTIYIIGGAAGAFRKEVFRELGMYSTSNITEDIELSMRIQAAGMRIVYAAEAIVFTEGAAGVYDLMKQRLRWKRGRFETFLEYRHLFFSTDRRHNKILSYVILPLAVFGDIQLGLELFFLAFLYVYSILTHDFSSFISGILVVSSMFLVQIMSERIENRRTGEKIGLLFLAPIGWLMFYLTTVVEFYALVRAMWGYLRKQELKWQKWQRKGVVPAGAVPGLAVKPRMRSAGADAPVATPASTAS